MVKRFILISITILLGMAGPVNAEDNLSAYFFAAARMGNVEIISEFLQHGFPVNLANQQSYTALMIAAYSGQYDVVKTLLDHGADACLQDKRGNTAIMGALIKVEVRIASMLYQQKCSPELANKSGLTLEEFAKLFGQKHTLESIKQE